MSDTPLLSKMDALLKKHRGGAEAAPASVGAPPPDAWLPVLTDVIERGTPPSASATAPVAAPPAPSRLPSAPAEANPAEPAVDEALATQLMSELAPRLSEAMEKQVASELRKNIDQTVAHLLSQLDVNVREIVRDAIDEKLKTPRAPSS